MFRKLRVIWENLELDSETPNKFTTYYGMKLKEARKGQGISQVDLAKAVYKRRPSISDMENGKMMPDLATAFLIAHFLDKPIHHFIHPALNPQKPEGLTDDENELMSVYRQLSDEKKTIALRQIQALKTR